jgi:hypothetical protein
MPHPRRSLGSSLMPSTTSTLLTCERSSWGVRFRGGRGCGVRRSACRNTTVPKCAVEQRVSRRQQPRTVAAPSIAPAPVRPPESTWLWCTRVQSRSATQSVERADFVCGTRELSAAQLRCASEDSPLWVVGCHSRRFLKSLKGARDEVPTL